jgi:hypothetical protein
MDKKNVVFLIAVASKHEYLNKKHGGFKYFQYSIPSWKYWCQKNNVELIIYDETGDDDHISHKPTWQRWFDVFKKLDESEIDYDKIALIDACTIIRWDTPNFFDYVKSGELNLFRSLENIRWVNEGVTGYSDFFKNLYPNFNFDLKKYSSCGWQIFDKNHKPFLNKLKKFYYDNYEQIMELQNNKVGRGTDQPVYNYLLQIEDVNVVNSLPPSFYVNHLHRFDWLGHNWQLNLNQTPFFIKHSYIWFYSGFPQRGGREDMMKQTWNLVKGKYV